MANDNLTVWITELGPLLDPEQAKLILNNHTDISGLTAQGFLLALDAPGGRKLYPAFQFSPNGGLYPEMPQILEIFQDAVETAYSIAAWLVSPQDCLEGETPADWVRSGREPERLYQAARHAVVRLRQ